MDDSNSNYERKTNIIRKIARIWSIVIIALVLFIFIAEIIGTFVPDQSMNEPYPWYENLIPMSMVLSVVGLAIAWRWEGFGSVLCILFIIATYVMYVAFVRSDRGVYIVPIILLPILIPGILFLISWLRTGRGSKQSSA
jgi:membrane protease YdiL (CAAX protease family)